MALFLSETLESHLVKTKILTYCKVVFVNSLQVIAAIIAQANS